MSQVHTERARSGLLELRSVRPFNLIYQARKRTTVMLSLHALVTG